MENTEIKELPVLADSSFGLEYKPAVIEMKNYDQMRKVVEGIAQKYEGQVITRAEKKMAEKSRSELITMEKSIDEERKAVKRIYNEPLKAYEDKMKELSEIIKKPLNAIRDGIAEIEQHELEEREDVLHELILNTATELGLDPISDIDIEQLILADKPKWANKGNFNAKLQPGTKLKEEVAEYLAQTKKEIEQRKANEQILLTFCQTLDVRPEPWLAMLDYLSPTEIMQKIQDAQKAEKERQERVEQQRMEMVEWEEKNAEALQVDDLVEPERITSIIQVTGTIAQLEALNAFLVDSGIQVEAYNGPEPDEPEEENEDFLGELLDEDLSLDDLPF